jgi:hypothetical protein
VLVGPVGRLKLPDLPTPVMRWEPVCVREEATETDCAIARAMERMVQAFLDAKFADCLGLLSEIDPCAVAS